MTDAETDTTVVVHLTTPPEWAAAQEQGRLVPAGFATEGFVHCSAVHQLVGTIEKHFAGVDELALLVLDTAAMGHELVWEEGRPGQLFPHLYRPVEPADVAEVVPWRRSPDGSVTLPDRLA